MKKFILGFFLGALIFILTPVGAAVQEYICYKADYKVVVNGIEYINPDLPILNHKGNTYAPIRSILETAGLNVNWNAKLNRAEVTQTVVSEVYGVQKIALNEADNYTDWISTTELRKQHNIFYTDTLNMSNKSAEPCDALLENRTTKLKIAFTMPAYDYKQNALYKITIGQNNLLMWTKTTHDYYFRISDLQSLGLI